MRYGSSHCYRGNGDRLNVATKKPGKPATSQNRSGEVFVYFIRLGSIPLGPLLASLAPVELSKEDGYRCRLHFERYVKCRGSLRMILAAHLGERPQDLIIANGAYGKPELVHSSASLHFNVAQRADYALIAIGQEAVGADIEAVRRDFDWQVVSANCFHLDERMVLETAPASDKVETFFQLWTHKEAFLKAVGVGLHGNLESFSTQVSGGWVSDPEKSIASDAWYTVCLDAPPGYKASVASRLPELKTLTLAPTSEEHFAHLVNTSLWAM